MKRTGALVCSLLLAVSAFSVATAEAKTVKVSFTVAKDSIWDRGAQKFKQLVEERSGGRHNVEIYANGVLVGGNDRVELEMTQAGAIDIALKSTIWLTQLDKRFMAIGLPWIFPNDEVALGVMDGPVGQKLTDDLSKMGVIPLAWGSGSFFQLYSKAGPVKAPADIKGVKIRVPGIDVFVAAWKELGAVPVSMSFAEVFPALQSGVIDGGTSPIPLIYSSRFWEVAKHISVNNFAFEAIGVLAGGPF
jgi:tripartite ATP-independent transporter DctP family solute receptor